VPEPNVIYKAGSQNVTKQSGIYSRLTLNIADPLKATVGGRFRETLNNSPTRKREAGEADLTGKQAGFFCQIAVFALNFPHFPFSGRTLGVGVE
jgi:outer membrane receptor for ferric coprogen and ferric-rhodotorulic acid